MDKKLDISDKRKIFYILFVFSNGYHYYAQILLHLNIYNE